MKLQAPKILTRTIALTSPANLRATGIRGLFVPARGFVTSVQLKGLPPGTELTCSPCYNNGGFNFQWTPSIELSTEVTLTIASVGDPIQPFAIAWVPYDDTAVGPPDSSVLPVSVIRKDLAAAQSLEDVSRLVTAVHRQVLGAIELLPTTVRAHARFFREYDYQTNPEIFQQADIFKPVAGFPRDTAAKRKNNILAGKSLRIRAKKRGKWRADGNRGPAQGLRRVNLEKLKYCSTLQLDIFKTHFGASVDVDSFWTAFESFMNGELRLPPGPIAWNGEPNSADAYLFAEFAFTAEENGIDAVLWRKLAKPLVAVLPIFNQAYEPIPGLGGLEGFSYDHYDPSSFKTSKMVTSARKIELRREYAGKTLNELKVAFGENAFQAFPGDYR
jgi:hypothetical protein